MQHSLLPGNNFTTNQHSEQDVTVTPGYAEIAIPLRVNRTFTYSIPDTMSGLAIVGSRVLVPFGHQQVTGYIVGLHGSVRNENGLNDSVIKPVLELLDDEPLLTPEILAITKWVADYYAAPLGEVLKAALPAGLNSTQDKLLSITQSGRDELANLSGTRDTTLRSRILKLVGHSSTVAMREVERHVESKQTKRIVRDLEKAGSISFEHARRPSVAKVKRQKMVRLLSTDDHEHENAGRVLTLTQQRVVDTLRSAGRTVALTELLEKARVGPSPVRTLARRGVLEILVSVVRRDPLIGAALPEENSFELNRAQSDALGEIEPSIATGAYAAFLLHGITGSGKTEIYIRAMRAALNLGKSAMMLVPEISLTPVFSRRLRKCFGDLVAIFHSSLSIGERFDEWNRLKRGEARIVIGTRSAVYAPVSNLGLIVVDEEHETSYRQHESPYYHGRDTAIVRARMESAVVLLGSATPSLESFYNADSGKYRYLQLPNRIADRALAKAEIIDMRKVFAEKKRAEVFSDQLLSEIETTHLRGEQSIVLLNRRGYSSFILCRSCGESVHCPNCDVTLTFHRGESALVCHYCNHRQRSPQKCPTCSGNYIHYVGQGTEQIEEMLRTRFPTMRIARLDRDTTSQKKLYERVVLQFADGELDMLVGTQMLAKGHDFPNVTLVGVVSVDAGLSLPDFRSAERTFQLITQVAGRAGRGERAGRVLIQTYYPDHYAIRHACEQDYKSFYAEEMRYRKNLSYPPFVSLASILVHGKDPNNVMTTAAEIRKALDEANPARECRVLGPAPAPLGRLKGEYRRHLLIKSQSRQRLRSVIDAAMTLASQRGCDMHAVNLEIDPVDLM